ncbi:MAG: hypothetical protein ACLQVI_17200 [Polyangiaceae bacterium]
MDCEKFESTLLDELYDELDEVTSAAAKRHVGGCSRCASLLSGLKTTRRLAVLPIVEPPADLEDRILNAAREAQKVVPLGRRASRAISWAGSWAMRPQTGMAAVFLLGIGLSALLLQGRHAAPTSSMTVSDRGEPVASVATETLARPPGEANEPKAAAAPLALAPSPVPQATPTAAASANAYGASSTSDGLFARHAASGGGGGRINAPAKGAPNDLPMAKSLGGFSDKDDEKNASAVAGAPLQQQAYGPSGQAPAPPPQAPAQAEAQMRQAPAAAAAPAPGQGAQAAPSFAGAKTAFDSGDYATATTLFDAVAQSSGDQSAALFAARSVRKLNGCPSAVTRFDQVMRAAAGTPAGNDATLEGGQCYRLMGQTAAAQSRLQSLLTVPGYVDRAKSELAAMAPKASAKAVTKPAAPPPASQKAVDQAY